MAVIEVTRAAAEKAKQLLSHSDVQIASICFDVGFNDPSYFTRIFKRTIGVTPSVYKANCAAELEIEQDIRNIH